jgi:hypothetical protein
LTLRAFFFAISRHSRVFGGRLYARRLAAMQLSSFNLKSRRRAGALP